MLEYKNNAENNIVEIIVDGKVHKEELDAVIEKMTADIEKHGKLRILEDIRDLGGIAFDALWDDIRFGLKHSGDFTHAAIVADQKWLRALAKAVGCVYSAEIKIFGHDEIDDAREWLAEAS